MKKIIPLLLLCALLCGCGSRGVNTVIPVSCEGITYAGSCSAPLKDGAAEGEGVFTSSEGWRYTGSFSGGAMTVGSVTDLPCTVTLSGLETRGLYTGAVSSLKPEGPGVFIAGDGSYTGSFLGGAPADGQCESFPVSVSLAAVQVRGAYTGSVTGGLLSGSGSFVSEADGRSVSFEGSWQDGRIAGAGRLTFDGLIIGGDRGRFEGETLDSLPSGQGEFTARNSENVDYRYSGEWKNGLYDGQGSLLYDSEIYYQRVGTFTAGSFTPTGMELLTALGTGTVKFTIPEKTREFLEGYPEVFDRSAQLPSYMNNNYKQLWNLYLTFPTYKADPVRWEGNWMCFFNSRVLYRWTEDSFGEDYRVTCVMTTTTIYTEPVLAFVFGNVDNLDMCGSWNAYGVPVAMSTYTNIDGDQIPILVTVMGAVTTYQ